MSVDRRRFLKRSGATALAAATIGSADSSIAAGRHPTAPRTRGRSSKRKISTDKAPNPAGPYSQAIIAGNTIYVAGQVAIDPATGQMVPGGFEPQAIRTFENVKAIVEAAGATLGDVVRVGVYLTDLSNFTKMNEIYRRYFKEDYPARTTIGTQLAGQYLIEVDCIAVKGGA